MELRHFHAFLALARHRHFAKAAESLGVSQSAQSQTIKQLEEELGAALVIRDPAGLRLTDAGKTLLKRARSVVREIEDARLAVNPELARKRSALRVGYVSSRHEETVAAAARVMRALPDVRITLDQLSVHQIETRLGRDRLDLGVVDGWKFQRVFNKLKVLLLEEYVGDSTLLLVIPSSGLSRDDEPEDPEPSAAEGSVVPEPDNVIDRLVEEAIEDTEFRRLERPEPRRPGQYSGIQSRPPRSSLLPEALQELAGLPFVLPRPTSPLRSVIDKYFEDRGVAIKTAAETSSIASTLDLVARGCAYSVLAASPALLWRREGIDLMQLPLAPTVRVSLLRSDSRMSSEAEHAFGARMREQFADLPHSALTRKRKRPGG
jgi:DNA-binding transcriptional LysR family regulator